MIGLGSAAIGVAAMPMNMISSTINSLTGTNMLPVAAGAENMTMMSLAETFNPKNIASNMIPPQMMNMLPESFQNVLGVQNNSNAYYNGGEVNQDGGLMLVGEDGYNKGRDRKELEKQKNTLNKNYLGAKDMLNRIEKMPREQINEVTGPANNKIQDIMGIFGFIDEAKVIGDDFASGICRDAKMYERVTDQSIDEIKEKVSSGEEVKTGKFSDEVFDRKCKESIKEPSQLNMQEKIESELRGNMKAENFGQEIGFLFGNSKKMESELYLYQLAAAFNKGPEALDNFYKNNSAYYFGVQKDYMRNEKLSWLKERQYKELKYNQNLYQDKKRSK